MFTDQGELTERMISLLTIADDLVSTKSCGRLVRNRSRATLFTQRETSPLHGGQFIMRRTWLLSLALALGFSISATAQDSVPPMVTSPASVAPSPITTTDVYNLSPVASTVSPTEPGKLFGLIAKSDHAFDGFISPMTNPVYFEDPRTLTEARVIFANHALPSALGGGNVQVAAMQLRAALTDRLSIIATKDGFLWSENPLLSDGFLDVNAGLKYNLFKDECSHSLLSTGFTYGIPLGSHQTLQGKGNGEFNLFLTGGQQLGESWHVLSTFGARIPANNNAYTESTYFSNHLDRKLGSSGFYLFTEANWYHWLSNGNQFPAPVEGLDFFNLGSTSVNGHDIVTGAYGVKYKPSGNLEIGVAYEIPYTDRRDILQNRLTADLIIRF